MTLSDDHVAIARPAGVAEWDVDPFSDHVLTHLEDYYAELRRRDPFVYIPRYAALACGRYAEVQEVFTDWRRFVSSRGVGLTDFKHTTPWRPPSIVLEVDPPYHTRTHSILVQVLSPRAVQALMESFRAAADRLVDSLLDEAEFDAATRIGEAFPTDVFPRAVGLTDIDPRKLLAYGGMAFNALGPDNERRRTCLAQAPEIVPWITEQCRRERLSADGLGADLYAAADRGELSQDEAAMLVRSLLSAGMDTTATGLGNAIWCLAQHPGAYAQLRAEPKLARAAFEETLRFTSPVHTFCRTSAADTEVVGVGVPADAKILCVLGAANLDPDHWPDADRFDITRRTAGHLAFGSGIHGCVGQSIARAEAEVLLGAIAAKVSAIELAGEPVWRPGHAIHALESLPVRFRPT